MSDRFWKKFVENPDATYEEIPSNFHYILAAHKDHSDPEWPNELAKLVCPICEALREKQRACRKTARITPRPQHGDVVIERDDQPTVLVVVRHRTGAPDAAGEALSLARRIARLEALEAVVAAIRLDHDQSIGPEEQVEGVKQWWKLPATKVALDALDAAEADR